MASVLLIKTELFSKRQCTVSAPLGILHLANAARDKGHRVTIMDMRVMPANQLKSLLDRELEKGYDIVGLSCIAPHLRTLLATAKHISHFSPNSFIIAGGPGPSSEPERCLVKAPIDLCAIGEGEKTFAEFLEMFDSSNDWHALNGIAFLDGNGRTVKTAEQELWQDIDNLPLPAWDLHDFNRYAKFLSMAMRPGKRAEIQTSRGCPYNCTFCHHFSDRTFRGRNPQNVLAEMKTIHDKYGVKRFEIIDDIFNLDIVRAKEILRLIRDELPDVKLSFPNGVRGDILDEEIIRLFKEAHTTSISLAIETASPRLQKLIRKNVNFMKIKENIKFIRKQGIHLVGFFMVGFPTETAQEIEMTFELADKLKFDLPYFFIVTPFVNTELWESVEDNFKNISDLEDIDPELGWADHSFSEVPSNILFERIQKKHYLYTLRPQNWFILYYIFKQMSLIGILLGFAKYFAPKLVLKYSKSIYDNQYDNFNSDLTERATNPIARGRQ